MDREEKTGTRPNGMPVVTDMVRELPLHYRAEKGKADGIVMVVAPDGGSRVLMMTCEGVDIAKKLNAIRVAAFVLKYRLNHTGPNAPTGEDVIRMAGEESGRPFASCAAKLAISASGPTGSA